MSTAMSAENSVRGVEREERDEQHRDGRWYERTIIRLVAKEKVTLTLDAAALAELRSLAGSRSISASVDAAVAAYVARLRHLVSVDHWLAELEREHGPVPPETLEWAAQLVDDWAAASRPRGRSRKAG